MAMVSGGSCAAVAFMMVGCRGDLLMLLVAEERVSWKADARGGESNNSRLRQVNLLIIEGALMTAVTCIRQRRTVDR